MSAPYEVWVFDGRAPERLGSVPPGDKAAARSLWRNSHHAVIAQGGVVLEPKPSCALKQQTALRVAVLSAWLDAGNAPPEPLPVPGTKVPGSKPARGGRPKPAPAEEDEDELVDEEEAADDCDGDDPDDPPEVDLEALEEDEASAPPSTPAPRESRAKRTPQAPQLRTPEASPTLSPKALAKLRAFDAAPPASPRAALDVSPMPTADTSPGSPSPEASTDASPTATATPAEVTPPLAAAPLSPTRGWVETTAQCEACEKRRAYRYRPELPEALRGLCYNDRRRAQKWAAAEPSRTPEQARDLVVTAVRAKTAARAARRDAARERALGTKGGRPRGRPPTPEWTNLRRGVDQLLRLAGRLGGVDGLRALEAARRVDPITTVAAMSARELARRGMKHLVEWKTQVDGRSMLVTAQWADGKSPLDVRDEALRERDAAVAALTAAQAASVRSQRLVERAGGVERLEAIFAWAEGLMKLGDGGPR